MFANHFGAFESCVADATTVRYIDFHFVQGRIGDNAVDGRFTGMRYFDVLMDHVERLLAQWQHFSFERSMPDVYVCVCGIKILLRK